MTITTMQRIEHRLRAKNAIRHHHRAAAHTTRLQLGLARDWHNLIYNTSDLAELAQATHNIEAMARTINDVAAIPTESLA